MSHPPVVSLGYICLDHVVAVNRPIAVGTTSLVERRYSPPSGRLGGCAANIAVGLAQAGVAGVELVSWVGADAAGERVLDLLREAGVATGGVLRDPDRRTGMTWLPIAPGGETYCIYDPGGPLPSRLASGQAAAVAGATCVVVAVGPPGLSAAALSRLAPSAVLVWAVKADPAAFPPELARALARRADVLVHNREEGAFLADTLGQEWPRMLRPGALRVETRGSSEVRYTQGQELVTLDVEDPLQVPDAVGAGDSFCAGLLGAVLQGAEPRDAVRAGLHTAGRLLRARQDAEMVIQHR